LEPTNNIDHLHKIDMGRRQVGNHVTKHDQWINIWNNRRQLTLSDILMFGPLTTHGSTWNGT